MKKSEPIKDLWDYVFVVKVLFVCRVPEGPKCATSLLRQRATALHQPLKLFRRLATEQSQRFVSGGIQTRHSAAPPENSFVLGQQPDETLRTIPILMQIILKKIWIPFIYCIMNTFHRHPPTTRKLAILIQAEDVDCRTVARIDFGKLLCVSRTISSCKLKRVFEISGGGRI